MTFRFCGNANWRMGNSPYNCLACCQVCVQGLSLMLQQKTCQSCDSHMLGSINKHSLTTLHMQLVHITQLQCSMQYYTRVHLTVYRVWEGPFDVLVCECTLCHGLLWVSPLCPCSTLQEQPPQVIGDADLSTHSQCTLWVSLSILSMGL